MSGSRRLGLGFLLEIFKERRGSGKRTVCQVREGDTCSPGDDSRVTDMYASRCKAGELRKESGKTPPPSHPSSRLRTKREISRAWIRLRVPGCNCQGLYGVDRDGQARPCYTPEAPATAARTLAQLTHFLEWNTKGPVAAA